MATDAPAATADETLRIDRWLWCARFYKSRAQAAEAVSGGRVHVNGARVKSSRPLRIGDRVVLSRDGRDLEFDVRAIPARRGPAPEARAWLEGLETANDATPAAHGTAGGASSDWAI